MEESRKSSGRPQVYNGEISDLARRMEDRRKREDETAASSKPSGEPRAEQEKSRGSALPGRKTAGEKDGKGMMRQREQDNIRKIKTLGMILGILIVVLIAALIYEVGLGHGTKKTRNEQMAVQQEAERPTAWDLPYLTFISEI